MQRMKVTFFKLHAKSVWLEGDSMIVIRWLEGRGMPYYLPCSDYASNIKSCSIDP